MAPDRRMTLIVAGAVLLTSTVLFPLFVSAAWFYAGLGALLTVAAAGALSRIRRLPVVVCLLITLAGLLLYLNVVFEARLAWGWVVPTRASVVALGSLAHAGFNETSKYAPPAPGTAGLTLLAVAGVGITAALADLIAVRLRAVALAGLPLLVLFTVPTTFNAPRSPLATGVIFSCGTAGFLAMLSADGRERIRIWGRLVSLWRSHDGTQRHGNDAVTDGPAAWTRARSYQFLRGPDTRALAAAGRRVGIASVVLALCAPLLVPGLHAAHLTSTEWVFGGSGGSAARLPDPLGAASSALRDTHPKTVLTYTTSAPAHPQYLQEYVMTLTGGGWQIGNGNDLRTRPVQTQLPSQAPGVTNAGAATVVTNVSIAAGGGSSGTSFLPMPFPPVRVYLDSSNSWQVDPETLMLLTNGSTSGLNYRVVSRYVNPSGAALSKVPPATGMSQYTKLPAEFTHSAAAQRLLQIVLRHTNGATSTFGKADALEHWFRESGEFTYSLYAPQISTPAGLLQFVTKTKTGDCVQFAQAMMIMLRMLGIPARLAVGFTQGQQAAAGSDKYVVKDSDAHAWPEVFFPGYGWIRFEPTMSAGQGTATPPGFDTSSGGIDITSPVPLPSSAQTDTGGGKAGSGPKKIVPLAGGGDGSQAANSKPSPGTPWTAIALAVVAAIALTGGVIAIVTPTARRARGLQLGALDRHSRAGPALLGVLAAAGVVALLLYRTLTRTTGLNLGVGWATVGIAFGATCAVALAVPAAARIVLRRWRWMRAADDPDRAHAAWEELCADLADYGIGYLPSESPRALAGRLRGDRALAEPAMLAVDRIALAEEQVSYAGRAPQQAITLRRDEYVARRGIAAAARPGARWRARIFPTSVTHALAEAAGRAAAGWNLRTARLRRLTVRRPG